MGKKNKQNAGTNALLKSAKTKKLGKKLSIENVYADYLLPELVQSNRRPSTLQGLRRNLYFWREWWSTQSEQMLPIKKIDHRHLIAFRNWCRSSGVSATGANRAVNAVQQIMRCAKRHGIIKSVPEISQLPHRGVSPKVFPTDDEICRIWDAMDVCQWPRLTAARSPLWYSPADGWRSLIVLLRVYGMRIQELVRMESGYRALQWFNIHPPGLTPNPEGRCECEYGWLSYTPQKQERIKPEPLYLPLNAVTKKAIDVLSQPVVDKNASVFDWPLSSVTFYKQWHKIVETAGVAPRKISGVESYTPKHFRKSATTQINLHRPGMAPFIVGHAETRSSGGESISTRHYDNKEQSVVECVLTMPLPERFTSWKPQPIAS